jgi:polysaccharide biosynthesis transport protein
MKPTSLQDSGGSEQSRTLADYIAIFRRRTKLIVLTTVAVAGTAFLLTSQQAKTYQATANVLLSRQDLGAELAGVSNPDLSGDPARLAQTASELARSSQVADLAIRLARVSGRTSAMLLANSSVLPQANADVLRFSVKDRDPVVAARLTNAFAEAFVKYKLDLDTTTIANARQELTTKIDELRATGDSSSDLYKSLVENEQQLRTMQLLQSRNVVLKTTGSGIQVAPTPKRTALLGAMLGLLVGLGLAFLWEALDTRLRSGKQIAEVLGLPLLARLPEPPRQLRAINQLAMIDDPTTVHAEAVRMLRSNLEVANLEVGARTIMVTSCGQREGKSTTIANLAVAFARSGTNVALVDLDLRQPIIATFFGLPEGVGITNVALDGVPLKRAMVPVSLSASVQEPTGRNSSRSPAPRPMRLNVLPIGRRLVSPGEFASTDALRDVLAQLRTDYDLVLIDAPPMCVVGDAKSIAPFVDALLVVAREGVVDLSGLENLVRELDLVAAPKLGFVLTGAELHESYDARGEGYFAGTPEPIEVPSVSSRSPRPATASSKGRVASTAAQRRSGRSEARRSGTSRPEPGGESAAEDTPS